MREFMKYFLSLLVIFLTCLPVAHAEKYAYVSYAVDDSYYLGKDTYTIDTLRNVAFADHGMQPIKLCQADSKFYCFAASSVVFSVPKKGPFVGEKWDSNGQKFTAERSEKVRLLGKNVNVFVISTVRDETRRDFFYYSTKDGLIGIKFVDLNKKTPYIRFLLLTTKKGFPK